MVDNLRGKPKLSGLIRESPKYYEMGNGLTTSILLIGHADGLAINDPLQVRSMQEAINLLEANQDSPLLRAFLEVYNAGSRDIWIVAAAPMSEYVSDVEMRFTKQFYSSVASPTLYNFYEKYYERLTDTYALLKDYDVGHIVVPVEAVWYDTGDVDFGKQLIDFCSISFDTNSQVKLGFLGTRVRPTKTTEQVILELSSNTRQLTYNEDSKFLSVFHGEGLINLPQISNSYRAPVVHAVAGLASVTPLSRGIPYLPLSVIMNIADRDYTAEEIEALLAAQVNPVIRNTKAKRGQYFNIVVMTDNTMGIIGTDFWSLRQMKLVMECANTIRVIGSNALGGFDLFPFRKAVYDYLASYVNQGIIKEFTLNIDRSEANLEKAYVDVGLKPYFGIRQIYFNVEAGAGTG